MIRKEVIGDATQWTRIYALCEGQNDLPRYVGKTVQYLHERHKAHVRAAMRGGQLPVNIWLAKQIRKGNGLTIKLLEFVKPGEDWASRERYWINKLRLSGLDLLNLTDGGEGIAGHQFSEDHKRKIANALRKGGYHSCDNCGKQFYRKPKDAKSKHLFCSKNCYQSWQIGQPKSNAKGLMGIAGREVALKIRRACYG